MNLHLLKSRQREFDHLEDLPNIGASIAADLRQIGIHSPAQLAKELAERQPLAVYHRLAPVMAHRHDPCVLYTLIAAKRFLETGAVTPWWNFTADGKALLESRRTSHSSLMKASSSQ